MQNIASSTTGEQFLCTAIVVLSTTPSYVAASAFKQFVEANAGARRKVRWKWTRIGGAHVREVNIGFQRGLSIESQLITSMTLARAVRVDGDLREAGWTGIEHWPAAPESLGNCMKSSFQAGCLESSVKRVHATCFSSFCGIISVNPAIWKRSC